MSKVVPGKKTLVAGPRQKFVFDWGRAGTGLESKFFLTETGPEPKIFFYRDRRNEKANGNSLGSVTGLALL